MKKIWIIGWIWFIVAGCTVNSVTGRKQLSLVSESELQAMSLNEYKSFLDSNKVVPSTNPNSAMVAKVGSRISTAITKYYDSQGNGSVLDGYKWEFNLVESPEVNAWCMPGGKVVVYTGLLPVTQNETALAIVMGHEIAHAIARHGNERMSEAMLQQLGGSVLEVALAKQPEQTRNIFMTSYGVGSQVGLMLPFSRQQESEADKLGLYFAAMAGYDPQQAIPFWQRMASMGGSKPPEFLSTHPADETRIKKLQEIMPEAMKYYNQAAKQ